MKLLFWNLNKKDLRALVCDTAIAVSADVVILLENCMTKDETLGRLKADVSADFHCPSASLSRFQLFCRDSEVDLSEAYSGDRISIRRLHFAGTELLLGMVHFVDKGNWGEPHQSAQVQLLAAEVSRREGKIGHNRTFLIGDFNMNPFDQAMNMAPGMNAMMTVKCVERGNRTVQKIQYPFFYNPMWGLLGDRTPGPPGTYYHSVASKGIYGWNMLDQVLVRPDAIPWFHDVSILTSAGNVSLRTQLERPDAQAASDHFPILLTLKREVT